MLTRFEAYLTDLRTLIGIFLFTIGVIVLLSYFFSNTTDSVDGVHVNLLGGSCLLVVGVLMFLSRYFSKEKIE